ncbi:glycosyltransferase [Parasphingorhabdus cellanae]|uniref:Glycosyltransferase n=1 Tax=Parasphingorhabdus cellanae TaxID=2806553 RepID=A0ABX7T602_9SPHN|nr:glycosyltransferase [Parasphingorhabdus cellanae]QTD56255.1 glycosyltransferase [Parasphingorhabdus cellanae]
MADNKLSVDADSASKSSGPIEGRVGVVVIGRNEGDRLVQCIDSLTLMGLPIVYVDSASTDGSPEAARSRGADVLDLDLATPFTAARARNEGFARLLSIAPNIDYIQFVDGDCEIEQGWIASATDFLDQRSDVAIVCGRRRERFPDASFYNKICDEEWNTAVGESEACGGDALMRKSSFVAVDGYNGGIIAGEEPELCSRMRTKNMRIWRIDQPMTVHDADMHHFRQWWLRAIRSGFGYAQVWWTTRKTGKALYSRELVRAILWALIIPLIAVVGGLFAPIFLLILPAIYMAQTARMAIKQGAFNKFSWKVAALNIAGKFGETLGIFRFVSRLLKGKQGGAIFYK